MTVTDQPSSPTPGPTEPDPAELTGGQWARALAVGGLFVLLTATTGIWGLVVVLGILLMVFLHELGHYTAAKKAGMLVTEFFIGFGPRIWSFHRGETEYGLKAIPAGAYVKIVGMHNLEEVEPQFEARTYRQGSFKDRLCVVLAGVAMNFAVAVVLLWGLLAVTGLPGGSLSESRQDRSKWSVGEVYPGTGAEAAGLQKGDRITAIDGQSVEGMDDLVPLLETRKDTTVQVTLVRDGATSTVPVELRDYTSPDGYAACCLGITRDIDIIRTNPVAAVPMAFVEVADITFQSVKGLASFFSPSGLKSFGNQVVNAQEDREARETAPTTTVPVSATPTRDSADDQVQGKDRLLSIIGFFQIGTDAAASGTATLMMLFVILNIGLGTINLVPLLPFDGGHAVIAIYERIQEKRQHLKGRYFTDVARLLPLTYVVVAVLLGIFVTTTYLDLTNPLSID